MPWNLENACLYPSVMLCCSSQTLPSSWDVFLSFRGIDTRYSFTSHLYSALDRHNIPTYRDDPELRCGEVISDALLKAIQESKIYVVVLSQNYASSSWCLDELVEILNCNKAMQRSVIPVFYNIDPSVVRYQKGAFEQDFKRHEIKFTGEMERVENWRLALKQVANNSGKHVDGKTSEADVVNEIVDEILLQIQSIALDVARYPVGLDSRLKDLTALLSRGTKDVIMIGIYGMGGIGKTTLAKALFNKLLPGSFKGSCFLANVREILGNSKGLESLQQQLVHDVLRIKNRVEVNSVDQGIKLIDQKICSTKILVVIDDLEDHQEFKSLVRSFAPGSVVIITTRDEEILDKIEVETQNRYKVNVLGDAESETLFFQHAFGDAQPNITLKILSKDILRVAGGLPLALEVFGSSLYKKSEVRWKSYIETLQRSPNSRIQQKLIISLEALESDDPLLKKMFLDIACLFIGWNKGKDMGKEITHNNSPDEPGKHSRLWVPKEICSVLKEHKGTEAIEGIIYSGPEEEVPFSTETLRRMNKLRFLYLKHINLTGEFKGTLEDLRWFFWNHCPLKCLPFDFCLEKLVILELPNSKLTAMWEEKMVSNVLEKLKTLITRFFFGVTTTPDSRRLPCLENLKTLNMRFSIDLTTTPDFTRLPRLENLYLEGCRSLKEVHISIGSLVNLVSLNLKGCLNLRSLPDTICELKALEVLCIDGCTRLEALPTQLGNVKSLIELNACWLRVLELPDSIGDLTKLVKLKLDYNEKLEYLPNTICNLRALEVLSIMYCPKVEALPVELGNIESLIELRAGGTTVSKLPNTICNMRLLEILDISDCYKLDSLPDQLWKLTNLSIADLSGCGNLLSMADLPPYLTRIYARNCLSLERVNVSNLKLLKELDLTDCCALTKILGLGELTSLYDLQLRGCHSSLLARTLTMQLFQIYCGFDHEIGIGVEVEKILELMEDDLAYDISSSVNLQANLSHNYLGMILCFPPRIQEVFDVKEVYYTVTTNYHSMGQKMLCGSNIVTIPRSIFPLADFNHTIKVTSNAGRVWFHLLYKNEDDNTTVRQ
ncbi:TMV resistance protein N isoform X3 [Daucus carota subsp. sativus]|uniref:TMV resistance protein N isoform X3 n=1 Tax=Daucus carota subsp. sativus TaxID=79200 RepID=UPI00308298BD